MQGYLLGRRPCPIAEFTQHTSGKGSAASSQRLRKQKLLAIKDSAA
jgi:hypothetical protein